MPTSRHADGQAGPRARHRHPVAFSIHFARNLIVQGLGVTMVSLMVISVLPWPAALAWIAVAVTAINIEHRLLRALKGEAPPRLALVGAPVMRVASTTIYAVAALALIERGGPGQKLFAVALMSASMVHVLMRHYRAPLVMAASLTPYMITLTFVGARLTATQLKLGHPLSALAAPFTIALVAIQFWSARAQLAGAWRELSDAYAAAEERERAADAANRAKSQFLATMSHELRTPLNGVLGMAQALVNGGLSPVQRDQVNTIRRSGESLLAVLNDLLDLSKIEAGALELETTEFDLEHLVRGVLAVYHPLAEKKGLTFRFAIDAAARGRYRGDPARIRRVLLGLCDNAVKFTEHGGVRLEVGCEGPRISIRIADTGIGIDAAMLQRLFEGFVQADSTATRRYGGVGVGLTICSRLTAMMGGVIEASSRLREGSAFTVLLPLERAEASARAPEAEFPTQAELRVLAAEDNLTNQLVLKTLLAPAGIAPTLVVNGREALDAWESQTWDIVLMDIQMPEMGGVEATRLIRRRELETGRSRTPILAVTANAMTHQLAEYDAAGMDGVVAKPFDVGKLFTSMDRVMAQAANAGMGAALPGAMQA